MLTYADRLVALRRRKIEQTLQKKEQNGCVDMDDFGTVPLPEGYRVEPWYNSKNGSFYGYDGMCENFCRVMAAHPPYVDPMELLCGRWRDMLVNYRGNRLFRPAWMKEDETQRDFDEDTTDLWSKCWDEERFPYDHLKPLQEKYNITSGIDSDAHLCCDYRIGLALGFGGLLEKIAHYREVNPDKSAFYDAEERVVCAIQDFIARHIACIEEMLATQTDPDLRASLAEMLAVNEKVLTEPPRTFHEVCQWVVYFNIASRIYTRDGAGFQLDTLLRPYYEADIAAGRIDDEKTVFLLADLLLNDPQYYQLSGVDAEGNDLTCHLSYLVLEAADALNIAANLTVRVHENCDPAFLEKAVWYLFKNKNGWPRFCGDKALTEGYERNGYSHADANARIAVGCNWMCVPGKEFPMNDVVKINIAKVFEWALADLRKEEKPSAERLFALYESHLKQAVETVAAGVNLHIDHQWEVTPELVMNLMMENTIERGEDVSQCASLYSIGVDGAGLAVVADSLGAITTRIEQERVLSWAQLFEALDNDFADDRIRAMMQSAPRYCQGGTVSDEWAKRLTDSWVRHIKAQPMPEGRQLIPGWFSWALTLDFGAAVGATPNGRRAGEAISHGANPNPGFRRDGAATAQSEGIASVQCGYGNTAPLQLEFDPHLTVEEGGVDRVCQLIRSHFEQGGTLININILDGDKLRAAHADPTLYPDLVVRVTGFTAYFVSLSPPFRQLVVDRFLDSL